MAIFTIDGDPNDWGRCKTDGQVIRWSNRDLLEKHTGHRVGPLDGFHLNELIRLWLGWL